MLCAGIEEWNADGYNDLDTLDLQDQENPSAAEHTKHPSQHGLAPHQAAEMNHVIEERHSEEQSLADAWASSGNMNEEPTDAANGHQHAGHDSNNEAGEHGAAEGESDDDMMDRISSSPSIEDGALHSHCSPPSSVPTPHHIKPIWPVRKSSLSPIHPTSHCGTFNNTARSENHASLGSPVGRQLLLGLRSRRGMEIGRPSAGLWD